MVYFAENKFDQTGRLTDEVTRQKVKEFMVALLQWIVKFKQINIIITNQDLLKVYNSYLITTLNTSFKYF